MEDLKQREDAVAVSIRYVVCICINLLLVVTVFIGAFKLCSLSYHSCYEIFGSVSTEKVPGQNKVFEIMKNDNLSNVSERLEKEGLIVNKYTFMARMNLLGFKKADLRPGKYMLNTSMDYEEVINQLTPGR